MVCTFRGAEDRLRVSRLEEQEVGAYSPHHYTITVRLRSDTLLVGSQLFVASTLFAASCVMYLFSLALLLAVHGRLVAKSVGHVCMFSTKSIVRFNILAKHTIYLSQSAATSCLCFRILDIGLLALFVRVDLAQTYECVLLRDSLLQGSGRGVHGTHCPGDIQDECFPSGAL